MKPVETTRLSSKGQIVLPQAIRRKLRLAVGVKFVVVGDGDTVILKKIETPSLARAKKLLKESQGYAGKVGLKPSDVKSAIRRVRQAYSNKSSQ
jgi:AbrB family looped-hinge helix DNA binding protein